MVRAIASTTSKATTACVLTAVRQQVVEANRGDHRDRPERVDRRLGVVVRVGQAHADQDRGDGDPPQHSHGGAVGPAAAAFKAGAVDLVLVRLTLVAEVAGRRLDGRLLGAAAKRGNHRAGPQQDGYSGADEKEDGLWRHVVLRYWGTSASS